MLKAAGCSFVGWSALRKIYLVLNPVCFLFQFLYQLLIVQLKFLSETWVILVQLYVMESLQI